MGQIISICFLPVTFSTWLPMSMSKERKVQVQKCKNNEEKMVNKWSTNGHQVIIHFHKLSSDFIHFHALSSIFIHYINFTHIHPLSSIFIHFIHFHPVPMGTFFSFWVPISVPRSPFSLIRAKERMKSLYSHILMLTI